MRMTRWHLLRRCVASAGAGAAIMPAWDHEHARVLPALIFTVLITAMIVLMLMPDLWPRRKP